MTTLICNCNRTMPLDVPALGHATVRLRLPAVKRGLRALLTDSIEVGHANWTPRMEAEFQARRGYALRPWLPALAGIVIGSEAETDDRDIYFAFGHCWLVKRRCSRGFRERAE